MVQWWRVRERMGEALAPVAILALAALVLLVCGCGRLEGPTRDLQARQVEALERIAAALEWEAGE